MKPILASVIACSVLAGILPAWSAPHRRHLLLLSHPHAATADLSAQLTVNSNEVKPGTVDEPATVQATYTVTNTTAQPVKFQQSGRPVIWQVVDGNGTLVVDPDRGKAVPMFIALRILQPGEHATFTENVPLVSLAGSPLAKGNYLLKARLSTEKDLATSTELTVD